MKSGKSFLVVQIIPFLFFLSPELMSAQERICLRCSRGYLILALVWISYSSFYRIIISLIGFDAFFSYMWHYRSLQQGLSKLRLCFLLPTILSGDESALRTTSWKVRSGVKSKSDIGNTDPQPTQDESVDYFIHIPSQLIRSSVD